MAQSSEWPIRNDVWLDNGLEFFGNLAEHLARQHPRVLEVQWEPDCLRLTLYDPKRFVSLLHEAIGQFSQATLFYTSERQGEKRQILKPFVGFNQQPPSQRPLLFQEERRLTFLETIFLPLTSGHYSQTEGCPLCGQVVSGAKQNLTLSVYPFVTKIKSLSGIRTRWEKGTIKGFVTNSPVCPSCYFLGALSWMDDALIYLCDLGGPKGSAVLLLPAPPAQNLRRLQQLKNYRPQYGERRSNVRFYRRQGKAQEVRDGRFSLLLAFMESTLRKLAEEEETVDLFEQAQRHISDGWLFIIIPQGRLKNIMAHDLILDEPIFRLLVRLVEVGILPYAHLMAELWLRDDRGKALGELTAELHENLAQAFLTDDFERFALSFVPKPRRQLRFPFALEENLQTIVQYWRWSTMDAQQLEVLKKAGRALAGIAASKKQPVLLYALERVRSPSDLLEVLKEGAHRLLGLEAQEMRYISLDALEQLTELAHHMTDVRQFSDLKNTLTIFAGVAYAKGVMAGAKSEEAGGEL